MLFLKSPEALVPKEHPVCEQLGYNILFRWFLDMEMTEAPFDHSTFSKNRERLMQHGAAQEFFPAGGRLQHQPANPQTRRGDLRLDENGRWTAPKHASKSVPRVKRRRRPARRAQMKLSAGTAL